MKALLRFFLIIIIAGDFAILAVFLYLEYQSTQVVDVTSAKTYTITIERGMGRRDIGAKLERSGLINNSIYFLYYTWRTNNASNLQAGAYLLSPSMHIAEMVNAMVRGLAQSSALRVTIPEGSSALDIEKRLRERGLHVKEGEFVALVHTKAVQAQTNYSYAFLKSFSAEQTLEGYFFPDTYDFASDMTAEEIGGRMLENFQNKAMPELQGQAVQNFNRIVTMASILEREVQTYEDMRAVAGVLEKRIQQGMLLQVDADSNTYIHRGLPPGPIANPGLKSIHAALNPQQNDYWFYLSTPDGRTIFSKTLDEHNINKAKFLR